MRVSRVLIFLVVGLGPRQLSGATARKSQFGGRGGHLLLPGWSPRSITPTGIVGRPYGRPIPRCRSGLGPAALAARRAAARPNPGPGSKSGGAKTKTAPPTFSEGGAVFF